MAAPPNPAQHALSIHFDVSAERLAQRAAYDFREVRLGSSFTGPAPFKRSPIRAECLDFGADFWKLRGPVLAYFHPFWTFWTSKIDSGWPDGSWHTKRELGSLSETQFRSFSSQV